jgi:glucose-1-phosphate thymidylyltransferase
MPQETLKIVIPMGGLGSRLRPHTWSKPKQLINVAGKSVLDHVLDTFNTLPNLENAELVAVVGYLGDQIEAHIRENYPNLKSHFVVQDDPLGQSHAIYLAKEYLTGPMLIIFGDTLIETDLSFLQQETADAVAWVKAVPDPRRFGVAEVGPDGIVHRLVEKPKDLDNNLVLVGCYYFRNAVDLITAIEEQMERQIQLKGEFYLADAVNIFLAHGAQMRIQQVDIWLDTGTPDALLETNKYLLEHGRQNSSENIEHPGIGIVPPVFIHPTAQVRNSVIGPNTSIGAHCIVEGSVVRNSILEDGAHLIDMNLENSLIGRKAMIHGRPRVVNAGDHTELSL